MWNNLINIYCLSPSPIPKLWALREQWSCLFCSWFYSPYLKLYLAHSSSPKKKNKTNEIHLLKCYKARLNHCGLHRPFPDHSWVHDHFLFFKLMAFMIQIRLSSLSLPDIVHPSPFPPVLYIPKPIWEPPRASWAVRDTMIKNCSLSPHNLQE